MSRLLRSFLPVAGTGAALLGYGSLIERNAFTVRHFAAPILPSGRAELRVLHISDIHLMPAQRRKQAWLTSLAALEPDLVINTGDNLAHRDALESLINALGPLLQRPGVFVHGSNDYYRPHPKNPFTYLFRPSGATPHPRRRDLPWRDLTAAFTSHGWKNLNNTTAQLRIDDVDLTFAGLDDPHLDLDDLSAVPPAQPGADAAIGVVHAPYLRVLDTFNDRGYAMVFAGHTHGGQVAVPGLGALVTNCDLDRFRAKGLHVHATPGNEASWLHVSAGCGTSPYAPVRFACRPEASLITLTSAQ